MIRQIRVEGDIAYVQLTLGKEAVIDAADIPLVDGINWQAHFHRNTFYAKAKARHPVTGKASTKRLHRVIMGNPAGVQIDHKDGDGLNNRRSNLRPATNAENGRNRSIQKNNTSGFNGVHKSGKAWVASIRVDGRRINLGRFAAPELASAAYNDAAKMYFGEFARITP